MASEPVVIVGGGQAGLSLSYRLLERHVPHVVLERDRIVESWRTRRWDSLRLIAPNWSLRLSGFSYDGDDPDGFMTKDRVVELLVAHARSFEAPVREGVDVTAVERRAEGFVLQTSDGPIRASQVVLATGALQRANLPPCADSVPAGVSQLLGSEYRNPDQLDRGAVLVVGNGETGCQIAEELATAGRSVHLSCGQAWWAPRRYRGRDAAHWLRATGWFERMTDDLPPGVHAGAPNPQLTGADGGHDINAHTLQQAGVRLAGRLTAVSHGRACFADSLVADVAWADREAQAFLDRVDGLIEAEGLEAAPIDRPAQLDTGPTPIGRGPAELDLGPSGVATIVWATGYRADFSWVGLPFLERGGHPVHRRGVTPIAGLYLLGLDWLHTAKSGLFAGIDEDATYLADLITSVRGGREAS